MSLVPSKVTDRAGRSLPRPLQRSPYEALERTPLGKSYLGLTSKISKNKMFTLMLSLCNGRGKFIMDNTKRIFIHGFSSFQIPYSSEDKSLIRNKRSISQTKRQILNKGRRDFIMRLFFQKIKEKFEYKTKSPP